MKALRIQLQLFLGVLFLLAQGTVVFAQGSFWQKTSQGIYEARIYHLALSLYKGETYLFASTSKALYGRREGSSFKTLAPIHFRYINSIYIPQKDPEHLFIATDQGLYLSTDDGQSFQRIFSSQSNEQALSVAYRDETIFLGTTDGLYRKAKTDASFVKVNQPVLDKGVYRLLVMGENLYAATPERLYQYTIPSGELRLGLSTGFFLSGQTQEDESRYIAVKDRKIKDVAVFKTDDGDGIVVATDQQILLSWDNATNWQRIKTDSLPLDELNVILPHSHGGGERLDAEHIRILAGTNRGAFLYATGLWVPVHQGLASGRIYDLVDGLNGYVYAATDQGLFYLDVKQAFPLKPALTADNPIKDSQPSFKQILSRYQGEPGIEEVQGWAVTYAEVHPDKIARWRQQARKSAWLPTVSLDIDADKNMTKSDSIWGSYSSGGQHYSGPDDKTFYDNLGWGVSLSWDLSEVIWNNDQTSIDSRSKMMVELREDILDQVTRLYYERRRIQVEIEIDHSGDPAVLLDRQLRLQELTALIDAYTGGKFRTGSICPYGNKEITKEVSPKINQF